MKNTRILECQMVGVIFYGIIFFAAVGISVNFSLVEQGLYFASVVVKIFLIFHIILAFLLVNKTNKPQLLVFTIPFAPLSEFVRKKVENRFYDVELESLGYFTDRLAALDPRREYFLESFDALCGLSKLKLYSEDLEKKRDEAVELKSKELARIVEEEMEKYTIPTLFAKFRQVKRLLDKNFLAGQTPAQLKDYECSTVRFVAQDIDTFGE